MQIEYRRDIDALRGLAVLLVVIYHAFPKILPGGFIGVDVFFVISGYLITSIILLSIDRGEYSLKIFYKKRINRLLPALITVLLAGLILGWFVLFPSEYEQLGSHTHRNNSLSLNFKLIKEAGYFETESQYKPLLHLWSLSIEGQFYLIWPLIIFFIRKNTALIFISGIFILSLATSFFLSFLNEQQAYFHTITRLWQLSAGSILAYVLASNSSLHNQNAISPYLFWVGALLIILSAIYIESQSIYPGYFAILPISGAIMIIIANTNFKALTPLVKIGLISYPLYLWHWLIISFFHIYMGRELKLPP